VLDKDKEQNEAENDRTKLNIKPDRRQQWNSLAQPAEVAGGQVDVSRCPIS
jgi:hypothetical protein